MQFIIIVCAVLSGGLVGHAQLNYEGNPLTDTIEYTAQESQSAGLNAREDNQRSEVADRQTNESSKGSPLGKSAFDAPVIGELTEHSFVNDDATVYEERSKKTTRETILEDNRSPLVEANRSGVYSPIASPDRTDETRHVTDRGQDFREASFDSRAPETRQLRDYPIESSQTTLYKSALSPVNPLTYDNSAYLTPEQSSIARASGQALGQFLNSRTPEESEIALGSYLTMRERALSAQRFNGNDDIEQTVRDINRRTRVNDGIDNEISANFDSRNGQRPIDDIPVVLSTDTIGQIPYLPRQHYRQQYPSLRRWSQIGSQYRREPSLASLPTRRYPLYRPPMTLGGNSWLQQPPTASTIYNRKRSEIITAGSPPGGPPVNINGNWKQQPVEVIYTRPPVSFESAQTTLANHLVPHDDANKRFPDSSRPPSQKDLYYSQLYAQSYDPHYYNYIAKTGKIKPWLYGKLGKNNEEKSIWSELLSGFKNHGMKNMMNPMFLLGMTIPTLTLALSALVQKRSMGRAHEGNYYADELIDEYESWIRDNSIARDMELEEMRAERESVRKVEKRSIDEKRPDIGELRKYNRPMELLEAPSIRDYDKHPEGWNPGYKLTPFEEYFLTHQALFAKAILAQEYGEKTVKKIDELGGFDCLKSPSLSRDTTPTDGQRCSDVIRKVTGEKNRENERE